MLELYWIQEGGAQASTAAAAPRPKWRDRLAWAAIAAVFAAAALELAFFFLRQEKSVPAPVRFTVDTPGNGSMPLLSWPSVSPDGESVLFVVSDPASHNTVVYLHCLATGTSRALPGTEGAGAVVWSFDSQSILMARSGAWWKMDLSTGSSQQVPISGSLSWGPDGIVTGTAEGLRWFRPDGAGSRWIKMANSKEGLAYLFPTLIPGGRWLICNALKLGTSTTSTASVHLISIDGKVDRQLLTTERAALYAEPGYLLYLRGDTLTAQAVDPDSGKLRGDPAPVASPVARDLPSPTPGAFSASGNGVLAFSRGSAVAEDRLEWFDRSGKSLGTLGGVADYSNPAFSPDGNRLAVAIRDPATARRDIWILDLARETVSRFTFDPADDFNPAWSPDGTRIAFSSDRRGTRDLYVKNASGTGDDELLLSSSLSKAAEDWSPDGRWIVQFSPDGKWLAYRSDESGRNEVYIRPFPPSGGKWQISAGGGGEPQWRGDGKELFYATLGDPARVMAVDIGVKNGAIEAGISHPLFEVRLPNAPLRNRWTVTRDGKKFLAIVPPEQKAANSFTVIVNWPSLLKKR